MKLKLNYWQAALLCFPFTLGVVSFDLSHSVSGGHQTPFAITNFLAVFDLSLLIYYQTYLVLAFNSRSEIKSRVFTINAIIPAVFFTWYLSIVTYATFINSSNYYGYPHQAPIRITKYHAEAWVIIIFFIHALITFLYTNRRYIGATINKIDNAELQMQLKGDYLVPMQILIQVAIRVYLITLAVDVIIDLVRMMIKA